MENTSWPSWRSTTWRMASTWVLCVAPLTASCKMTPLPLQPEILSTTFILPSPHPSPHSLKAVMSTSPTLLSLSGLSEGIVPTSPLQILLAEDRWKPLGRSLLLQAALFFFFSDFVSPSPTQVQAFWNGEGRAASEERWDLFHSSLHSLLFKKKLFSLRFLFSDELKNHFTFCYCCTHNPSVPLPLSSHPSYLPLWDGTSI